MNINSPIFDRIRIKPARSAAPPEAKEPGCDHPGCAAPGKFRAPKGRGNEGQYWRFCMDHVRAYNASYNYFDGMTDTAVQAYQKEAVVGHRPTWEMGVRKTRAATDADGYNPARDWDYFDPLNVVGGERLRGRRPKAAREPSKPKLTGPVRKALDVLGLDENADGPTIKSTYKTLVKRFHPDAHGGDRSFEERLRDIIRAHDILKTAGKC